jgi:hypothetical protein
MTMMTVLSSGIATCRAKDFEARVLSKMRGMISDDEFLRALRIYAGQGPIGGGYPASHRLSTGIIPNCELHGRKEKVLCIEANWWEALLDCY